MLPPTLTHSLVINANLTQRHMTSMEIDLTLIQGTFGSNAMTINCQSTTNLKNATKMIDFLAENMVESTAVPLTISQMIYHHIMLQPMETIKQINCFQLRLVVKSIPLTITSPNGLMKLGI